MAGFDLNTVSVDDLTKNVKMLGRDRAEKIIKYRDGHGKFNSLHDLKNVSGISDRIIDDIKNAGGHVGGRKAA